MIYAHVDVSGRVRGFRLDRIPVGRMVQDEVRPFLNSPTSSRVVGQSHGLKMIAKRIETNRQLDNPNKPIGFYALRSSDRQDRDRARARGALSGGEQNMITINMSEFRRRTVSRSRARRPACRLRPGGRLTEAVRGSLTA
jgi:type VI secretion system protein VasG